MPTLPGARGSSARSLPLSVSWMCIARATTSGVVERRDGERGDPLAAADEAEALAGRELDVDLRRREADGGGQARAHLLAVGAEARRLADDGGVDARDAEAPARDHPLHVGEEARAVGVAPALVAVGEVLADVA